MDKVYRGGVCNLAACDAPDSNGSLFSSRQPQAGGAIVHRQTFTDCSVVFSLMPDWPELIRDKCSLYRRGWVMQERLLSQRIIHFSQFPVWECSSGLATEGYPLSSASAGIYPLRSKPQRGWLRSRDGENDFDIIGRWWTIIDEYSKCSLTYNSDRLVAISGIAKTYSVLVNEPYYAGIWGGKYLLLSLLWRHHRLPPSQSTTPTTAPLNPTGQLYIGASDKNICRIISQKVC